MGSGFDPLAPHQRSRDAVKGGASMFERFTDGARRVVVLAQEEARMLNHNYIGTEHILLALVREGDGVAGQILLKLGADFDRVRRQVMQLMIRPEVQTQEAQERRLAERVQQLTAELERLRGLFRQHGIDPDDTA